jgi:hypothetical protein
MLKEKVTIGEFIFECIKRDFPETQAVIEIPELDHEQAEYLKENHGKILPINFKDDVYIRHGKYMCAIADHKKLSADVFFRFTDQLIIKAD